MNRSILKTSGLVIIVAAISAGLGYWLAHGSRLATVVTRDATTAKEQQVLYWYDPMSPAQHFDKPGKSPYMDMPLVAKYADAGGSRDSIRVSDVLTQNLGVRYATVEYGVLNTSLQAPANVAFNERDVEIVQTRSAGFVEKVYPHAPGDVIAAGTPLLQILVPEWAGAQAEYLGLRQEGEPGLAQAAKERLRLLGMPEASIRQMEKSGKAQSLYTVASSIAGVIQSLEVRQGMTISSGMTVARINGLDTVWLEAAVPEAEAGRLKPGQAVHAVLPAYPEMAFNGRISAVLPEASMQTRTLRIRMEFANPQHRLRPGMFARVQLDSTASHEALLVPTEAVIRTGKRDLLIKAEEGGRFRPVAVTLGEESGGKTVLLSGAEAGQKVVASGQFLIDSEASLKGVLARMEIPEERPAMVAAETGIAVRGVIKNIGKGEITISHDPIPALDWPAMTMAFAIGENVRTSALKKGQTVRFILEKKGDEPAIISIEPVMKTGAWP